jgi:hypothetical protein
LAICVAVGAVILSFFGYRWQIAHAEPGSSVETAIVITGPQKGYVYRKYEWLAKLFPPGSASQDEQYLVELDGHLYDIEVMKTPKGERKVYFDITAVK